MRVWARQGAQAGVCLPNSIVYATDDEGDQSRGLALQHSVLNWEMHQGSDATGCVQGLVAVYRDARFLRAHHDTRWDVSVSPPGRLHSEGEISA